LELRSIRSEGTSADQRHYCDLILKNRKFLILRMAFDRLLRAPGCGFGALFLRTEQSTKPVRHGTLSRQPTATAGNDFWLLVASGLYLYVGLFTLRGTPYLMGGDQVFFWMDAQRLLSGERIYRDFFQYTPPGTDLMYLAAFRVFGMHIWVTNVIVLALGVLLCQLCFRTAALFLEESRAMLAASIFIVLIYGRLLNATHHWFSEAAVLGAVLILMQGRDRTRIGLAGALLGVATFFTQTRGPAAALAFTIYLLWHRARTGEAWPEYFKRVALLLASLFFTWICLSVYFIFTVGLREMWYCQVSYVLHSPITREHTWGLPAAFTWSGLPYLIQPVMVYAMLPTVYVISLLNCWTARRTAWMVSTDRRLLLTLVGLTTALEVAQSPNWLRVYCVAAPGILLVVWAAGTVGRFQRHIVHSMWAALLCVALWQTWSRQHSENSVVQLPTGRGAASAIASEKLVWIARHTKPGDGFFQAAWPGVYLPLALHNPVFADGFSAGDETRPGFVARSIRELESKPVRYILWTPRLNSPAQPEHPETYHLASFRAFLAERYRRVWVFSDHDEIWERN
jgi:hypothetical protein